MNKKKKKNNDVVKKIMDNMCDNISIMLMELELYPGTKQFDETFYEFMDEIEEEIKIRVIKRIRSAMDN